MLVPVNLLWKVRLSIRKKLALGGIFSVTVIIMVFAIVRVIVISSYSPQPDQSWLYMWSSVEQAVCKSILSQLLETAPVDDGEPGSHSTIHTAIMVACLASFPSLFGNSERDRNHWAGTKKLVHLLLSPRSWSRKSFTEISEFDEQESNAAFNLPGIPGGTMTAVRTFIDKQGKTVTSNSHSIAMTEEDEDSSSLAGHIAHRQV